MIVKKKNFIILLFGILVISSLSLIQSSALLEDENIRGQEDLPDEVIYRISILPFDLTVGFVKIDNFTLDSEIEGEPIIGNISHYCFENNTWMSGLHGFYGDTVGYYNETASTDYIVTNSTSWTFETDLISQNLTYVLHVFGFQYLTTVENITEYFDFVNVPPEYINETGENWGIMLRENKGIYIELGDDGIINDWQMIDGENKTDEIEFSNLRIKRIDSVEAYTEEVVSNIDWSVEIGDELFFNYTDYASSEDSGYFKYEITNIYDVWTSVDFEGIASKFVDTAPFMENYSSYVSEFQPKFYTSSVYGMCYKWNPSLKIWEESGDVFERDGEVILGRANKEMIFPLDDQYPNLIFPNQTTISNIFGIGEGNRFIDTFANDTEDIWDWVATLCDTTKEACLDDLETNYGVEVTYTEVGIEVNYDDWFVNCTWNEDGTIQVIKARIPDESQLYIRNFDITSIEKLDIPNYTLPIADFEFDVKLDGEVSFTDTTNEEYGIIGWLWDFGDGTNSTEQNPSHIYTQGTYNVSLTVTDDKGESHTVTKEVIVGTVIKDWVWWTVGSVSGIGVFGIITRFTSFGKKNILCKISPKSKVC